MERKRPAEVNRKIEQLERYMVANTGEGKDLTSDAGLKISNDQWSLRAGPRGPVLLQDSRFYKKQSHLNRERIPERVVHARGYGAHGYFELQKSMRTYTKAGFLQDPGVRTPLFVRFSTLIGSRGSKDTAQDVRGFAVKFYTEEGNYDLLGLSFQVFLVADAMKFADAVHAIKPNPRSDIPQASSAHDSFWDYVTSNQETAHMIMWLMSDRSRPRSFRMMDGYPVNTFRFINEQGRSTFVRFHFRAVLGVHSLLIDEAALIGGIDPDFHRRDLKEAIDRGAYPEYTFGVQLIDAADEFKFDFDVLDNTKLWPEEDVPLVTVGKIVLNRTVENDFAETEQASFDPSNIIPGIDFSNDPVLQGRTFAYRDTDYHRLGTGNIEDIPINQPLVNTFYNQRDGFSRYRIDVDAVDYHNNALAGNTPAVTPPQEGGFATFAAPVEGEKTRAVPSASFTDHFSQARLFWNSMSAVEQRHITESFNFHLGQVHSEAIRQAGVDMFAHVDHEMAKTIALQVGVTPPRAGHVPVEKKSPGLSQMNTPRYAYTQKVGVLIGRGFPGPEVTGTLNALQRAGVFTDIISEKLGMITGTGGATLAADRIFLTTHAVLYDSVYVVGGQSDHQAQFDQDIVSFVNHMYRHYKPIGVASTAESYVLATNENNLSGVVFAGGNQEFGKEFIAAIAQQRFWQRT